MKGPLWSIVEGMLSHIVHVLSDPTDGTPLRLEDGESRLVSESGHSYDVAKQGYVTLAGGAGLKHVGDDLDMVRSREAFLSHGHFAPFVEAVTAAVQDVVEAAGLPEDRDPVIVEVGAGTGYYLAHTLDSIAGAVGVGLDISQPAAKHLAKCHDRVGAVIADVWERLPFQDNSVDAISVVFAPRNPAEFRRILAPGGEVVVLTPQAGHLKELREPLGLLDVEPGKVERMLEQAEGYLEPVGEPEIVEFTMRLDKAAITDQIGMSPSARHIDAATLEERLANLPQSMDITAVARLDRLRPVR